MKCIAIEALLKWHRCRHKTTQQCLLAAKTCLQAHAWSEVPNHPEGSHMVTHSHKHQSTCRSRCNETCKSQWTARTMCVCRCRCMCVSRKEIHRNPCHTASVQQNTARCHCARSAPWVQQSPQGCQKCGEASSKVSCPHLSQQDCSGRPVTLTSDTPGSTQTQICSSVERGCCMWPPMRPCCTAGGNTPANQSCCGCTRSQSKYKSQEHTTVTQH